MRSWSGRALLSACAVALVAALAPGMALADSWSAPTPVDPALLTVAVSCATSTFCVAVGNGAAVYNGTGWSEPADVDPGAVIRSVSCRTATFCVAGDQRGDYLTYDGVSWSAPQPVDVGGAAITAVSCPSATQCFAVDDAGDALSYQAGVWTVTSTTATSLWSLSCPAANFCMAGDGGDGVLTYDGGSWSSPVAVPGADAIMSLSCTAKTFCAAVDDVSDVFTYNGTTWSAATNERGAGEQTGVGAVSCSSASFCVASGPIVATYDGTGWTQDPAFERSSDGQVLALAASCLTQSQAFCVMVDAVSGDTSTYQNGSWSTAPKLLGSGGVTDISCASASFCAAVDLDGGATIDDDGSWAAPQRVDPGADLTSVSCPQAGFCAAADDAGHVLTYRDGGWSAPETLDASSPASVSCASASFCVAVDMAGNAFTYNGSSWSASDRIDASGLTSVSCPAASFCAALDDAGDALLYNGLWSQPGLIDPNDSLLNISCASASFCVAVGLGSTAVTYNAAQSAYWIPVQTGDSAGAFLNVSCAPQAAFCVAVDTSGDFLTYDGLQWSAPESTGGDGGLLAVSCPTAGFCSAASVVGSAQSYTRTPPPAPTSQQPPTVVGTAGVLGATLGVDYGSWTPTPVLYSEQWEDCDSAGANCAPVAGQTSTSYTVSGADVGHTIRVIEQAAAPGGQLGPPVASPAVTAPTSNGGPPAYPTVPPEFFPPPAPAVPAPTATTPTPTPTPTTRTAAPAPLPAVTAAEVRVALAALLSVPGSKKALAGALKHGYVLRFDAPGAGRLRVDWYYTPPKTAHSPKRRKPELIGSAARTISAAGRLAVKVTLTSGGKALLRTDGRMKVSVAVSFTPHDGTRMTTTAARWL